MAALTAEILIDEGFGETRALLLLNGRPERLLYQRDDDRPQERLGARLAGRLVRIERAAGVAFFDGGDGASLAASPHAVQGLSEGALAELEVTAEPRAGKAAAVRVIGPATGYPRLLAPGPAPLERLKAYAPAAEVLTGPSTRDEIDAAEALALAPEARLPGGGSVKVERTRALTAVDVDAGAGTGQGDPRRAALSANRAALAEAARLIRLAGLGGLIVVDLIGRRQDADPILKAARAAFAPDEPGVVIGALGKFGTLELVRPWRERPVADRLAGEGGVGLSPRSRALAVLRRAERALVADPGGRFALTGAPETAPWLERGVAELAARYGARIAFKTGLAPARPVDDLTPL